MSPATQGTLWNAETRGLTVWSEWSLLRDRPQHPAQRPPSGPQSILSSPSRASQCKLSAAAGAWHCSGLGWGSRRTPGHLAFSHNARCLPAKAAGALSGDTRCRGVMRPGPEGWGPGGGRSGPVCFLHPEDRSESALSRVSPGAPVGPPLSPAPPGLAGPPP